MRVLAAIGAVVFAYLAIIPAGLVVSTVDPACAGGACRTGLGRDILMVVAYSATFVAVAGTSAAFSLYAFRRTVGRERLIRTMLLASVATVGLTFMLLFAIAQPIAAVVTVAIGAGTYWLLRRGERRSGFDPSANGHASTNGHPG